jgi:hypothetical protein
VRCSPTPRCSLVCPQAFLLYDSKGFPLDLTQRMAEEAGLTVDIVGYNEHMERQRESSKVRRACNQLTCICVCGHAVAGLSALARVSFHWLSPLSVTFTANDPPLFPESAVQPRCWS